MSAHLHFFNSDERVMINSFYLLATLATLLWGVEAGDMYRKAIVFYPETPELFYCPQDQPISLSGMIVKAKPLSKLCQFEGKGLPDSYVSDCWNDVDETDFACDEKRRILLRLKPPGSENAIIDNFVPILTHYKIATPEMVAAAQKRLKEQGLLPQ